MQPKVERLSKQLLNNFQGENSCDRRQLMLKLKMELLRKKSCRFLGQVKCFSDK